MTFDILRQMIKPEALVTIAPSYSSFSVHLEEPQQPDSMVIIKGLPENVLILKVDKFPAPDTVFMGTKGECRRSDYLIIAEDSGRKRLLFIEMKRKKAPECEITEQFKGAVCFVAYCKEIAKQFFDCNDMFSGFEYRFVSFGHTSIPKRKTRFEKTAKTHDRPDKMLKVDWPNNLYFNQLSR
jgi:hypothetical protein